MKDWELYKKVFSISSLEEIYKNHVILGGAIGVDKVNHNAFKKRKKNQLDIVSRKAIRGSYKFTKYRLKLISKCRGKYPREISIPTIRDRIALRAICDYLSIIFADEINFELPQRVIKLVKTELEDAKFSAFIKLDIQDFYPSINHETLMNGLKTKIKKVEILNVIESSITTSTVEKAREEIKGNKKGIPQGLSISNILAAIYLLDVDKKLKELDFSYFRYVDDILILCDKRKAKGVVKEIKNDLHAIDLSIHDPFNGGEKSKIGEIGKEVLSYLGYEFQEGIVTVRLLSIDRLRDSLTSIFTAYKYSKKKDENFLLWRLNLRITGCVFDNKRKGWLFFFSEITDLDLLHRLDHYVNILCKRFGVNFEQKNFIRAYYQIIHNFYETKYIPKFDKYSGQDMKEVLRNFFGIKDVDELAPEQIEYYFKKRISQQVKDLDTDLQDFGY